jgi:hypothetical protein
MTRRGYQWRLYVKRIQPGWQGNLGGTWLESGMGLNPPLPKWWFRENMDSRQYHLHVYLRQP